jgi:hypothetical protein
MENVKKVFSRLEELSKKSRDYVEWVNNGLVNELCSYLLTPADGNAAVVIVSFTTDILIALLTTDFISSEDSENCLKKLKSSGAYTCLINAFENLNSHRSKIQLALVICLLYRKHLFIPPELHPYISLLIIFILNPDDALSGDLDLGVHGYELNTKLFLSSIETLKNLSLVSCVCDHIIQKHSPIVSLLLLFINSNSMILALQSFFILKNLCASSSKKERDTLNGDIFFESLYTYYLFLFRPNEVPPSQLFTNTLAKTHSCVKCFDEEKPVKGSFVYASSNPTPINKYGTDYLCMRCAADILQDILCSNSRRIDLFFKSKLYLLLVDLLKSQVIDKPPLKNTPELSQITFHSAIVSVLDVCVRQGYPLIKDRQLSSKAFLSSLMELAIAILKYYFLFLNEGDNAKDVCHNWTIHVNVGADKQPVINEFSQIVQHGIDFIVDGSKIIRTLDVSNACFTSENVKFLDRKSVV